MAGSAGKTVLEYRDEDFQQTPTHEEGKNLNFWSFYMLTYLIFLSMI